MSSRSAMLSGWSSMIRIFILGNVLTSPDQVFGGTMSGVVVFTKVFYLISNLRVFGKAGSRCLFDNSEELLHVERLGQISARARGHETLDLIRGDISADHYHRYLPRSDIALEARDHFPAG